MFSIPLGRLLIASVVAGILGVSGIMMLPTTVGPTTDMRLEPLSGTKVVGESFVVQVLVTSDVPVNVFKGSLLFDPQILQIEKIDYNTSIANLWAELPWYSNGDGTMNFIGGTTKPGGFTGEGSLITITFRTLAVGNATVAMNEVRILKHDGLGSEADVRAPIDAIFAVESSKLADETVVSKSALGPQISVVSAPPSTDLNGDGKQTIIDTSIFMADLATQNMKSDFNQDGVVNLVDLSILNN